MRLNSDEIFYLNEFSSASGANARDCVIEEKVVAFLVKKDAMGKAIGRNAETVKRLRQKLRRNIEIFEYDDDVQGFIKKALYNIKIDAINIAERNGKKQAILQLDSENKRKLLNNLARVKRIKAFAKRDYNIDDVRTR